MTTFPTGSDHGGNDEDGPPFHCLLFLLLLLLLLGFQQDGVVVDLQVEEHSVLKVDTLRIYITLSTDNFEIRKKEGVVCVCSSMCIHKSSNGTLSQFLWLFKKVSSSK